MKNKKNIETIYMFLLNEGVDVWRPVKAKFIQENVYEIISKNEDLESEIWEFQTGDIVFCIEKRLSGGKRIVPIKKLCKQERYKIEDLDIESTKIASNQNQKATFLRYEHPTTGKSVVVDKETDAIVHLGGEGWVYSDYKE